MNKTMYKISTPILLVGAVGCLVASPGISQTWPDPVSHEVLPYATAGLTHGPCVGTPTDHSVKIWIRTQDAGDFDVIYGARLPLGNSSAKVSGRTDPTRDNTGVVTLDGLQPNTQYFYGVRTGEYFADLRLDYHDPWPSFRTLPNESTCRDPVNNPRGLFNFAFSVGCCASQDPFRSGGQYVSPPAFDTLLREHGDEIAFHIMNGDTIYEELRDGTREGIRANYRLYWERGRSWARLIRNVPMQFTYDDHEIGWDIHGCGEVGREAGKWLIRDPGVSVWNEYCGWASHPQPHRGAVRFGMAKLVAGSSQLHDTAADFSSFDLATVSTLHIDPYTPSMEGEKLIHRSKNALHANAGVYGIQRVVDAHTLELDRPVVADGDVPYSIGTHHYYDWQVGNCHFFALDTRGERTQRNVADLRDRTRFILGAAQKRWLLEGVAKSRADFIFVICPDPFVIQHTAFHVDPERGGVPKGDGFSSYVHEREELIGHFDRVDKPVLIFTGDVHASASVQITDNVWEMMCGPMGSTNHPIGTCGGGTMPFGGRWESIGRAVHIKWIGTFPDNVNYSRLRQPYYAVVQINNVSRSPRPTGTGYQWVAYDAPQVVVRWHDGYTGRLVYAEGISGTIFENPPR